MTRPRDKNLERLYVKSCADQLGAEWTIVSEGEAPDFIVSDAQTTFGLEVTQAFQDSPNSRGSRLRRGEGIALKALDRIRREFERRSGTTINATFATRPRQVDEQTIVDRLLSLGLEAQTLGSFAEFTLADGTQVIARRSDHPYWHIVSDAVGWVDQQGQKQLQHCIEQKSPATRSYGTPSLQDLRLLVVADAFLNSGKIRVKADDPIDNMGFKAVYFLTYPREVISFTGR